MRALGLAERALEALVRRAAQRTVFGRPLAQHDTVRHDVAECRLALDTARALVMHAARRVDAVGGRRAAREVTMIKVRARACPCPLAHTTYMPCSPARQIAVPRAALQVVDRAIQVHGALGVSQDSFLPAAWAALRSLRLADGAAAVQGSVPLPLSRSNACAGPDEVHLRALARAELQAQLRRAAPHKL